MESAYTPISDYAIVGDCRSAALISRQGSIDWLCWPRFDSPSIFGALLDPRGGRFSLKPAARSTVERHYRDASNVLETCFQTEYGRVCITDVMAVFNAGRRRHALVAQRQLIRRVAGVSGAVEMELVFEPRWPYGSASRVKQRGSVVLCEIGRGVLMLNATVPLRVERDGQRAIARWKIDAGQTFHFSLCYDENGPAVLPASGTQCDALIEETDQWWRRWSARCRFEGEFRAPVVRSLLALKLLAYSPSGAVIAAPTTSLPEWPGGVRNWDYRYCWLRDSALTVRAFLRLGYEEEATAFLGWLLHSTKNTWPRLRVLYDVYGRAPGKERTLDHLDGYGGARPVRIGNRAADQLQLDVYGELAQAVWEYMTYATNPEAVDCRSLAALGKEICRTWWQTDAGIWETRAARRHHTYSKVMCWVALDRLLRLHRQGRLKAPEKLFERTAQQIRSTVEREGYDEQYASYVSAFGHAEVDASLLRLATYGYIAPTHPRMDATYRRLRAELGLPNGLILRNRDIPDGLPPGEGAFLACSFWEVEYLAERGDTEGARRLLKELKRYANDVGLFSEEVDPATGASWGNFPQSYSHVGLITAALSITQRDNA